MHSPIRSESDVFRWLLAIGLGAGLAVVIGALTDAAVGGVIAGLLVGIAIGMVLRAGRGSLPERVEIAAHREDVFSILVLANETVEGPELIEAIRNRAAGAAQVELLVISPSLTRSRLELIASDTDGARAEAQERLERSLRTLRDAGFSVAGATGDEDPVVAAKDALREFGADELVVSTHPPSKSRWLERGVVEQLRVEVALPLTHVSSPELGAARPEASAAGPPERPPAAARVASKPGSPVPTWPALRQSPSWAMSSCAIPSDPRPMPSGCC